MDNMLDLTPAEALERLRACYSAHVERFVQAGRAGDWRDKLAGWLSGGGGMARRAQDEALSSFYQDLKLGVEAPAGRHPGCRSICSGSSGACAVSQRRAGSVRPRYGIRPCSP